MNYGMYLSATGVLTNSHRQDVIANNLANAETVGYKRNLALFHERLGEAIVSRQQGGLSGADPLFDLMTGGHLVAPTAVDRRQGELEHTGNSLDVAIQGRGYFSVLHDGQKRLTRDGRFMLDRAGHLIMANSAGDRVLDPQGKPIVIDPTLAPKLTVADDGQISADGLSVAQIGLFDVADPSLLVKRGGTLLSPPDPAQVRAATGARLRNGFVERSNVDPTLELTQLMDAQRQLEANANMIRYQDQTLGKLVNEVGKIG
jgi:flagellar basal body rod protein FlgG